MNCQNCGSQYGCSCEKRTATDGRSCCRLCIDSYQSTLNLMPPTPPANTQPGAPIINSVIYNPAKL